jgi:cell division septation protein DedD
VKAPRVKPVAQKPVMQTAAVDRFVAEVPLIKAAKAPAKQQIVAANVPHGAKAPSGIEAGKFVVQLGAFSSANAARAAWSHSSGKFSLGNYDPAQSRVKVRTASLYRLSVSGFVSREDAGRVCTKIRADGGTCFVRSISGEATPQWAKRDVKKPTEVAAR